MDVWRDVRGFHVPKLFRIISNNDDMVCTAGKEIVLRFTSFFIVVYFDALEFVFGQLNRVRRTTKREPLEL